MIAVDSGYLAYLAERAHLGYPSRPDVVASPCPWCGADPYSPCIVRAIGQWLRRPHDARRTFVAAADIAQGGDRAAQQSQQRDNRR